ncbi:DNA-3-methyladenine glycosylase I [Gordonia pseudamarae]|uniref:DNA-3-methyladenine glycosylase I n=1 Tax=Gordonia pseudamarae TaxID=2831662 RepID=A0ABX6IF50_9ACTN|nr:DNA-3-methyladenine glycosylase I [Gordonia sp. (in: high G+C Gram-positive bacteria)]QHN24961.1 DNA-3-methyladenine glycosylase I [Gordonia pseudamarae]QHN33895.1 DNA-3-methyladenine glycosylase I [Gordonia pseudamarae]
MNALSPAADGVPRCSWAAREPETGYHDTEWGFPVGDDVRLFEKICLEGFQSGLSWRTILLKRDNFRAAFAGFDIPTVAGFGEHEVERLLGDAGIIRHRGKINAAINNAARALELIDEAGSLAAFVWRFEPEVAADPTAEPVSITPESVALSTALKKRGWKFVGPTTMYAFMQSMGVVNDHAPGCLTYEPVARAREQFSRPKPPAGVPLSPP